MVTANLPSHIVQEISFSSEVKRNQTGNKVKQVQEWLEFHHFATAIDSDFGPATERCVKNFQEQKELPITGVVDQATYIRLVEPLTKALKPIQPSPNETLGDLVLKYAKQHLSQHPIELGGQNRGPWVRVYMDGKEGVDWPWCAGFVTFILKQACAALDCSMPISGSFGCDELAHQAHHKGRFVSGSSIENHTASWNTLKPCCIFLVRRSSGDWTHTGFAFNKDNDTFSTIEGNTNDTGSPEGYEVCQRTRSLSSKDFIRLG